jgi:O-antigen ligase
MNYTYAGDYPHNLYLDAFFSSGVFTFLGIIIASIKYLHLLISQSQDKALHAMLISFIPIYIGSLFSGTLYNNYSILAVMISSLFLFSTLQNPPNISLKSK